MDNPFVLLLLIGIVVYVGFLWRSDRRSWRPGIADSSRLPGASPAPRLAIWLAVLGSLAFLGIEAAGEYKLGIVAEQSDMTWLFAVYSLFAAFGEELMFRGFVIVDGKGKGILVATAVGGSVVFALLHGHWYENGDAGFRVLTDTKSLFSTGMLFAGSLWFYFVRFWKLNPERSLLPCIAAHLAKNLGVIGFKLFQGHVVGLY